MDPAAKPVVVVSAVNFVEGGPLSILQDCLRAATAQLADRFEVVALVHRESVVGVPGVRYLEFPDAKRSWLRRLRYEYSGFKAVSRALKPRLWLSLHDVTPRVSAERQAVYCHNPAPFYRLRLRDALLEPSFAAFNLAYRWAYRANIRRNRYVIVQQDWLRRELGRYFDPARIVVAHPDVPPLVDVGEVARGGGRLRLVYPAFPRVFKNIEVLAEAARLLAGERDVEFEIVLTIDGTENRYARDIRRRFGTTPGLVFAGLQSRAGVYELYRSAHALVFPSKLETWGMPLTEFRAFGRPILAANLPYAHETLSGYASVKYFDADDPRALADLIAGLARGTLTMDGEPGRKPAPPFVTNWADLFALLLNDELRRAAPRAAQA